MATPKNTNKAIPLIVGGVIFVAAAMFASNNNDDDEVSTMEQKEQATVPDGDSTADTLRTLTATVTELTRKNENLSKNQLDLEKKLSKQKPSSNLDEASIADKLESLVNGKLEAMNTQQEQEQPDDYNYDLGGVITKEDIWVEPIDEATLADENGFAPTQNSTPLSFESSSILGDSAQALDSPIGQTLTAGLAQDGNKVPDVPVYTIPKNSTLIGSTTMSALIGRIPNQGNVEDPYPVKIIVGKDNLTANGLELPEVSHMIFTGSAVGDWMLSCVRANLTSVTYVFDDGTIRTLTAGSDNVNGNRLAWISDTRGIPCISGKRISNSTSTLISKVFAKGVEAGAGAIARAEETLVTTPQGDTTSNVTGDVLANTGYKSLSGGAKEISDWLNKREAQNFDVIYVDTGMKVNINIDAELPIDYAPNGRKLRHDNITANRFANILD